MAESGVSEREFGQLEQRVSDLPSHADLREVVRDIRAALEKHESKTEKLVEQLTTTTVESAFKLQWAEMMRGYGIVLFLNWYARVYGGGSEVCYFDTLRQRQKYQKWKTGNPVGQMIRQWGEFIRVWIKIRANAGRIKALAAE